MVVSAPLVIGVDSSTQSVKVEARALGTGEVVAIGRAAHPPTTPPVSEQDPVAWWAALCSAMAELGDHRTAVVAISIAGQQHGMVLVDGAGDVVRPARLWNDTTSAPEAEALVADLGADYWAQRTGSVPVASFTIAKLAQMAAHEAAALARAERVMLPHDYLTWRLCGRVVTDRGDASGSGWFDPSADAVVPELLRAAGAEHLIDGVPEVLGPLDVAGTLSETAAAELGLPAGITVAAGTGDNMAAALGLGLRPGDSAISLGTSGTVFAVSATPTHDITGSVAGFADADGGFLPLVCTLNATRVTDTVASWLGRDAAGFADLALAAVDDPGTAILVPYFDGERTPNLPDATGGLLGLTNTTTPAQLALAAVDGVLCGLLEGRDALGALGVALDGRIFLIGGGSRSVAARQRAADLTGTAVVVPDTDETVATGAAVQAAAAHEHLHSSEIDIAAIQQRWSMGAGLIVEPGRDASDRRERYRTGVQR